MTESYLAGEIVITAKLDVSALRSEFSALKKQMNRQGKEASNTFALGFESGQIGKQIQRGILSGLDAAGDARESGKNRIRQTRLYLKDTLNNN